MQKIIKEKSTVSNDVELNSNPNNKNLLKLIEMSTLFDPACFTVLLNYVSSNQGLTYELFVGQFLENYNNLQKEFTNPKLSKRMSRIKRAFPELTLNHIKMIAHDFKKNNRYTTDSTLQIIKFSNFCIGVLKQEY